MHDLRETLSLRGLKDKLRQYLQARRYNDIFLTEAQKQCLPTGKIKAERAEIETAIVTLRKRIHDAEKRTS